jgi:hypothetical protein
VGSHDGNRLTLVETEIVGEKGKHAAGVQSRWRQTAGWTCSGGACDDRPCGILTHGISLFASLASIPVLCEADWFGVAVIRSIGSDHSRQGPDIGASNASLAVSKLRNYWLKHGNGVCETVVAGVGQINATL